MKKMITNQFHDAEILVVEDNPPDLKFLTEILKDAGYKVRPASDGELALRSVKAKQPDIILLDLNLPDINGIEVCRQLKDDPETEDIPIIFISAEAEAELEIKAFGAGGVDYVTKPFEASVILARIQTYIKLYRLQIKLKAEIKARKQTEETLRETELKNRLWIDNSPVCTKIVDLDFNLQFMSASGVRELKIDDINEFYGKPYPLHFYPDSFKIPMTNNLRKVKDTGEIITQEASIVDTDGNKLWYQSTIVPVYDDKGNLDYIMVVSLDTTNRKLVEEELQKNQAILNTAFDNSQAGIAIADAPDGKLRYANKAALFIRGEGQEELVDNIDIDKYISKWHLFGLDGSPLPEDEVPLARAVLYGETNSKEFIIRNVDESDRIVWANAAPIKNAQGEVIAGIVVFLDITDKKKAEKELVEREKFLDRIIDQSPFATWISDAEGTMLRANPALKKLLNLTDEQLVGKYNVLKDEIVENAGLMPLIRSVFENGKTVTFTLEWDGNNMHNMDLEGSKSIICEGTLFPIYNIDGQLTNTVLNWIDITDRKKIEGELNKTLDRYNSFVKASQQVLWNTDATGNVVEEMPLWTEYTGRSYEQIKKWGWLADIHPDDQARTDLAWKNAVKMKKTYETEFRLRRYDGEYRYFLTRGIPIFDDENNIIEWVGACIDITEHKQIEEEIVKHRKHLEELVKERTKELEDKNKELDNTVKVFVGRELTIQKLQERIKGMKE